MCGLGEMQRSYSPTRRNTLCTSRPSTIRGDAWARKNTQRQYHDRNFRNQLRSQNQRCLQLSAAACSACCFDSKSIATRRAKNTSTNQSCLQQPYHCIFSHQKVCLSWGPVGLWPRVEQRKWILAKKYKKKKTFFLIFFCFVFFFFSCFFLGFGFLVCFFCLLWFCFCFVCFYFFCQTLYSLCCWTHNSRWPGTCAQPCGPLYRLRSMLSVDASSTGRNELFRECCLPWSQDTPISLSRSRCVVAFHSHFSQSTDWHGLLSIPISSKVGTLGWTWNMR